MKYRNKRTGEVVEAGKDDHGWYYVKHGFKGYTSADALIHYFAIDNYEPIEDTDDNPINVKRKAT